MTEIPARGLLRTHGAMQQTTTPRSLQMTEIPARRLSANWGQIVPRTLRLVFFEHLVELGATVGWGNPGGQWCDALRGLLRA